MKAAMDINEFLKTAEKITAKATAEGRLIDNPDRAGLRKLVMQEEGVVRTIYDSFVAESEPTSRAQIFTKNSVDNKFGEDEIRLLAQCERALAKEQIICIDRIVGNPDSRVTVRLLCPARFAHIAYGGRNLFAEPQSRVENPDYTIIFFGDEAWETNRNKPLPEKDITIRLALLNDGRAVKIVRNSNYIGEYKKGVFACEDWVAKTRRNGIFLHAGCREDYLQTSHGAYQPVRTLLIALSANGKTTTTGQILARKGMERSWLVQDDGGTLMPDGSFRGFEAGGIFVKTEGVNAGEQPEIFYGLLRPETVLENVHVTDEGDFDFDNYERTSNGRAVVRRIDFMHASQYIDVPRIDNIVIITRGPTIPAICKLNLEEATALMVLGQAMESSAGDPTRAGKIRTEFFYDPFMAGDKAEHANRFYDILSEISGINYYLMNTGSIGEGERFKDITVANTMGILDSLLRGGLEDWVDSPSGFQVPAAIRSVDNILVHPERLYTRTEFEERQQKLNRLRTEAIEAIGPRLNPGVRKVFEQ